MPPTTHNHVFNHVALSVGDCDAAVDWYTEVFGFQRIRSDRLTDRTTTPNLKAPIFKIYGAQLHKVKTAFLGTPNSVGFEVFEFIDPPHQPILKQQEKKDQEEEAGKSSSASSSSSSPSPSPAAAALPFPYTNPGFFHIAVTAPDVDETCRRAIALGGKQIGETVCVGVGEAQRAAYLSDPWGNVVEVLSCSFEALLANTG